MASRAQTWVRVLTLLLIPAIAWGCPGQTPAGNNPVGGNGGGPLGTQPNVGGTPNFGNPVFPSGRPYGPPPPSPLPPGVSPPPATPTPLVSPLGDPSATPVANPSPTPTPIQPSPTPPPPLDPFLQPPKGVLVNSFYVRQGLDNAENEVSQVVNFGAPRGVVWMDKGNNPGLYFAMPGPNGDAGASGAVCKVAEEVQPNGTIKRFLEVIATKVNLGDSFGEMQGVRGLASDPENERLYLIEGPRHVLRLGIFNTEESRFVFVPHAGASGTPGYADLVGGNARFNDPWGVAVDRGGNAYVSDRGNHTIRKVTLAQVTTTLAGNGVGGFADGNGKSARFQNPQGIAIDAATGNLYVADRGNHAIRKVTPEGMVTTVAGGTRAGFKNANSTSAEFNHPSEVLVVPTGLVVWDEGNACLRHIDLAGNVTTYAGDGSGVPGKVDGPGQLARFQGIGGMALEPVEKLVFISEPFDTVVNRRTFRVLDPSAFVTTVAGFGRQAPITPGHEGNPNANVVTLAGELPAQATEGFEDGASDTAKFNEPWGIAVTDTYLAYVADSGNHAIRRINLDGSVSTLAGTNTAGFADGNGATARFNTPRGVALDRNGNLIVADQFNHRIRKVTPSGDVTTLAGTSTPGFRDGAGSQAQFNNPRGVAVDLANNVYVADTANHRVRIIAPDGTVSTYAGEGLAGLKEGTALLARFSSPVGVAVTHGGKVYVADYGNSLIRAILPGDPTIPPSPDPTATGPSPAPILNPRTVLTVAGSGAPGWFEGAAKDAKFNDPWALATDSNGTTYVADYGNSLIRKIDTVTNLVSLFAGLVPGYPDTINSFSVPTSGYRDGRANGATFAAPAGLALDRRGYLWVSDSKNHRVRLIQ